MSTEPGDEAVGHDELRLASRNHAMPLEALALDVTPVGLHFVMCHYDIPLLDTRPWRLDVVGLVEMPRSLSVDDLRALPSVTATVTMECAGNGRSLLRPRPVGQPWVDGGVGTAQWTGTPLADVLAAAGVQEGAVDVVFSGADHGTEHGSEQDYARSLSVADATSDDVLLAWAMNGAPLAPQHGAPLRLVVPGWYGMASVKWLRRIEIRDTTFTGFHQTRAYRVRESGRDVGVPVRRIRPRALLRPPGFPDYLSRIRVVEVGDHELTGRAWCGSAPVTRVEVSTDDGDTWADAEVSAAPGSAAWQAWRWRWAARRPGRAMLRARAHAADGSVQPDDPRWNVHGVVNNATQRVEVLVRA